MVALAESERSVYFAKIFLLGYTMPVVTKKLNLPMWEIIRISRNVIVGCLLVGFSGPVIADTVEIILQPSDLIRRGNAHIETGDLEKAKEALSRALETNLTSRQRANAHNSMCVANIKEEAWEEAMMHCNAAIKLTRTNWRFFNNRGNIYLGLGQLDLAMENYQRGLRIAPKSKTLAINIEILEQKVRKIKPRRHHNEEPA